jgi:hypothetical protein
MALNGTAVGALAIGGLFLYSALFNKKFSATLKDVITGDLPAPGAVTASDAGASAGAAGTAVAPEAPASVSGNVATGKLLAAAYGWSTGAQWNALYAVWQGESGWDNTATNGGRPYDPENVAYGIPQALPAVKMGVLANPPLSSAAAQIAWGLGYIKDTYGTPEGALESERTRGFY